MFHIPPHKLTEEMKRKMCERINSGRQDQSGQEQNQRSGNQPIPATGNPRDSRVL